MEISLLAGVIIILFPVVVLLLIIFLVIPRLTEKQLKKLIKFQTGTTGVQGATGSTGHQGSIGLTGAAATNGTNGLNGATGPTGVIGVTGPVGQSNNTGATGPAGPPSFILTLDSVGTTPNPRGGNVTSGSVLNFQPANGTNPGLVSTVTQSIGGPKTFANDVNDNGDLTVSGDIFAAGDIRFTTTGKFLHSVNGKANAGGVSMGSNFGNFNFRGGSSINNWNVRDSSNLTQFSVGNTNLSTIGGAIVRTHFNILDDSSGAASVALAVTAGSFVQSGTDVTAGGIIRFGSGVAGGRGILQWTNTNGLQIFDNTNAQLWINQYIPGTAVSLRNGTNILNDGSSNVTLSGTLSANTFVSISGGYGFPSGGNLLDYYNVTSTILIQFPITPYVVGDRFDVYLFDPINLSFLGTQLRCLYRLSFDVSDR